MEHLQKAKLSAVTHRVAEACDGLLCIGCATVDALGDGLAYAYARYILVQSCTLR